MSYLKYFIVLALFVGCQQADKKNTSQDSFNNLSEILASPHRTDKNRQRDRYRNPKETLDFFEIKPNMKVLEISPSKGWYTEILGPYLKKQGELHLAIFSENTTKSYLKSFNKALKDKLEKDKDYYGKIHFTIFEAPKIIKPLAKENSMDRVLTFRNVHNWMRGKKAKEIFKEFHRVLKPGGLLGVVEHRASSKQKQDPDAKSGYVRQDYVIALAESAGFKLVDSSEINANPKDHAQHPKGVWTLPPALRLGDQNKQKYLAIGESDRMTLKFIKK